MQRILIITVLFVVLASASCSQDNTKQQSTKQENNKKVKVGGGCEGCEAIYQDAPSFEKLSWIDTLPDFNEQGPKLVMSGVIYQPDGITPAPDVILYVYHTDQTGHYTSAPDQTGWARRNGRIRGWMKTNAKGEYKFYTLMPGHYPGTAVPSHIHPIIKEVNKNEYYIDEYLFDDDPSLTTAERKKQEARGGNGIVNLEKKDGILYGERDIYLGRNIPDYPQTKTSGLQSGLSLGDNCPAFEPLHLSGPDKGKHVCPMCKYGYGQGVMVWFNHTSLDRLERFATLLEGEIESRGEKQFRVFLVYMNPTYNINKAGDQKIVQGKIEKWCAEQNLQRVAMLWVPSPVDEESCGIFKINPKAENTVLVYKKRKVAAKWVNIEYDDQSVKAILSKIDRQTL
jgi:protocatechuate 3,4-dioxygenase beta subunit